MTTDCTYTSDAAEQARRTSKFRLLSIVEALTVTGPIKPLLMFSALARGGIPPWSPLEHLMLTTRRQVPVPETDPLLQAAHKAGIQFMALRERHPFDMAVMPEMAANIKEFSPHLVETHDCKSHFLFALLRSWRREFRNYGWVAFHHGYTTTSAKVRLYQQLDRWSLRHADRVVTLCQPFAQMLERRGVRSESISVLSNAATVRTPPNPEDVRRERAQCGAKPGDRVILAVGRLSKEKGHSDLLAAFAIAAKAATASLLLLIAGEGPERRKLEAIASRATGRVQFLGHVEDPWLLYHAADIFVLPSHSEGSPLVVLEAMAAQLPIVATSVGGVPELLKDGLAGILTAPHDPVRFAENINLLANDPNLRITLASAAKTAVGEHAPRAYAERLLHLYDRARSC